MATIDDIKRDWIAARKEQDRVKSTLLGTLVGAIMTKEKSFSPTRPLTNAEVLAEVKKMLEGLNETSKYLPEGDPRREQNDAERTILEVYIPRQMTEAEIEAFVVAKKSNGANMGAVMAALKSECPGMYDGKLASEITKRVLAA